MPHEPDLLLTLAGALAAALALGLVAVRLRLSPIVGYLLAGVVVGPFTPGFVAHGGLAAQLAEVGVILLMFGVGLQFHVEELLAVRKVAVPGALVSMVAAVVGGALGWKLLGGEAGPGVVLGLSICVSSTVVLVRVLGDHDALHTSVGHTAVGWLVVEDVFAVLVLVLLPIVFGGGNASPGALALAVAFALGKVGLLVVLVLVLGRKIVPAVLVAVARTRARDVFTLAVLAIALGVAVGSAKVFGVSMALGAFLAGLVVGQSPFGARAASDAIPMKDAFAVLFFVSVGMMLDPSRLGQSLPAFGITLLVSGLLKPAAAFVTVRALGLPVRSAAPLAATLGQVGEFSFIVAGLGRQLGVLTDEASQGIVLGSIVTIAVNPFVYRAARGVAQSPTATSPEADESAEPGAVVIGYGPVGRTLVRLLRDNGITPTVVELNHELADAASRDGVRAICGDASQRHTLELAGIGRARTLVFAASGSPPLPVVQTAKELNGALRVLARAPYLRDAAAVRGAGADVVVVGEAEVAFAMTEQLLASLGATPEQLDRARTRVREELAPT